MDFERARQVMMDGQLRAEGVTETRLLSRFARLAREDFVPSQRRSLAYADDLHWFGPVDRSRFMPAPATLGKLLQQAEIGPTDAVLDVGATTGYASAVAAGLAQSVVALESDAALAEAAAANLARLSIANVRVVTGTIEQFSKSTFDVILLQGAVDSVPAAYLNLLGEGGRLVTIVRHGAVGTAHVFLRAGGKTTERATFNALLPPLPGSEKVAEFEL